MMERMAKCGNKRVDFHACRNLHNLIRRKGKILPVHVSFLEMQKRMSRKKLNMVPVAHPIVRLSDWARVSFKAGGHFFLRGNSLANAAAFGLELQEFWSHFGATHPDFPLPDANKRAWHIPIAIHGDEGRGRAKQPILIIAFQPLLPLQGQKSNMRGLLGT